MAANWNEDELNRLIQQASGAAKDTEELKKAAKSRSVEKVLQGLRPEQARKLQNVLADDAEVKRLLSSPQAQEILKKLMGGQGGPKS